MIRGVVSGGQTGADRAALDAAARAGFPCGGWCPAGRWAEDGALAATYPLRETPSDDPAQRTAWNVFDSDATLLLTRAEPSGGSALAAAVANRFGRPLLVHDPQEGAQPVLAWLDRLGGSILLNVAGPRESDAPGSYRRALDLLLQVMTPDRLAATAPPRALITGSAGLLGQALLRLVPPGWEVHGTVRDAPVPDATTHAVELSDASAVAALIDRVRPALVIHTAYSMHAGQRDILEATRNLVAAIAGRSVEMVHLSSDTVLDGLNAPFDECAPLAPVSEYGRWKAAAEEEVRAGLPGAAIVRPSLIVGFEPPDPRTAWIRAGLLGHERVTLFIDELRTPIMAADLARQVWEITRLPPGRRSGVWHLGGPESLSRFALGTIIAAAFGLNPARLGTGRAADFPEPRPRDLRLLTRRAARELLTPARPLSAAASEYRDVHRTLDLPPNQD